MTNADLDRWLAEKVMGWTWNRATLWYDSPDRSRVAESREDYANPCLSCDWWHPTSNVAQAIEAAEKARGDGRIESWALVSPMKRFGNPPIAEVTCGSEDYMEEAETYPLALCRALYTAIADAPGGKP